MAWSFVGVSAAATATGTPLTLTEPAGVLNGDLLIACIACRTTSLTSIVNTGWTLVNEQKTDNILTTTSAIASGVMLYRVRGTTAPDLTFTLPASGTSVAFGRMVAYRGNLGTTPLDVSAAVTTAINTTAVSVTGLTTTQASDLIVAMCAGGQEATWSAFDATDPSTASGATNTSTAPTAGTWIERVDSSTVTGADTSLAIFDAIKTAAGATGNLTATASLGAGHVVIAGAFKIGPEPTSDAWNIYDRVGSATFFDGDKRAVAQASLCSVRSTEQHANGTAGKYYAEFVGNNISPGGRVGIGDATAPDYTSTYAFYATEGGIVQVDGVSSAVNLGTASDGDIFGVAWDAGVERVWFRRNGGLWNNNASADPATNTNGVDVSAHASVNHALWARLDVSSTSVTVRTEAAEFTYSAPSGFTSWMGETIDTGITGTLVTTEALDSANLAGATEPIGTLAASEARDTVSASGAIDWQAIFAATETADAAVFDGAVIVPVTGTFAVTETADTANLAAAVRWLGDLAATEASDTADVSAAVYWPAALAAPELPDTANINAAIIATGTLAASETADAANIAGGIVATGSLAVAESADVAVINGGIIGTGTLVASEAADVSAITGNVVGAGIGAILAATEAADQAAITGQVTGVVGTFAASEASDTAALTAAVRWLATLSASETADAANLAASVQWFGTLAATEAPDVAVLSGPIPILGTLAAQEAADQAAITATARHTATLAVTEAADSSAFSGTASVFGTLAASDAPDAINIPAGVYSTVTLAATEAADAAAFRASAYDTIGEIKTYFVTGRAAPSLAVTGTKQPHALTGKRTPRAVIIGTLPPPAITARRNTAATWIAQQ